MVTVLPVNVLLQFCEQGVPGFSSHFGFNNSGDLFDLRGYIAKFESFVQVAEKFAPI